MRGDTRGMREGAVDGTNRSVLPSLFIAVDKKTKDVLKESRKKQDEQRRGYFRRGRAFLPEDVNCWVGCPSGFLGILLHGPCRDPGGQRQKLNTHRHQGSGQKKLKGLSDRQACMEV